MNSSNVLTKLKIATRSSELALIQTGLVVSALADSVAGLQTDLLKVETTGDRIVDRPLTAFDGKGLFTSELDRAIHSNSAEIAVHSLKDLPIEADSKLIVQPVLKREDPREVLVSRGGIRFLDLPPGSVVGTSSHRRRAQLLAIRNDLIVKSIRGNVPTRVSKVDSGEYDAVILAGAGLIRLGLTDRISEWFSLELIVPAPAQGCIAATVQDSNIFACGLLQKIADPDSVRCALAERYLLQFLGGGCAAPISAIAEIDGNGDIRLLGRVDSLDGSHSITRSKTGKDPNQIAKGLGSQLLNAGAKELIELARLPLAGKNVVVTRAAAQMDSLSCLLREQGASPVEMPLIKIFRLADSEEASVWINRLQEFDWIVFTSSNSIEIFFDLIQEKSLLHGKRLACTGSKAADRLKKLYREPDFVPKQFTGNDLADQFPAEPGEKVFLPGPLKTRARFVEKMATKNVGVERWALYETRSEKPTRLARKRFEIGEIDAVTFASPSAVESFCEHVPEYPTLMAGVVVACIGTTTAECAADNGLNVEVTPSEFTIDGLVNSLIAHFAISRQQ